MASSIVGALEAVCRRQPHSLALQWRGATWTYSDLLTAIDSVRAGLLDRGISRGARIALLLRNSPQYVASYYAALSAGMVAVPLNAQERATVLARQIEHCEAALLVGDPGHPEWAALRSAVDPLRMATVDVALHEGAESLPMLIKAAGGVQANVALPVLRREDRATIIYTSGTTGRPKGVTLSHGNLLSNATAIIKYLELCAEDRGLCVLPFHFSYGNSVLHTHLLSGALLVLEDNFAFPHLTLRRLQDAAITGFAGVPSTFSLLLGRCRLADFDLKHLRYITQAGGAMPKPLLERLHSQAHGARIFIMYGQTEATARLTYLPPHQLHEKAGSVGIPIDGVEIEVRDSDGSVLVDAVGEIYARGPNVMLGYWNDPAATGEAVRDGWLRTGDLGRRDADGFLYIEGRTVEMIKVGAFRVSPQEVEEVVAAIDGVDEVAVTAIADEMLGQAIKAVVVLSPEAELQPLAVKEYSRQHLASYKVPKVVEFAPTLPRTSSGKIQRFKLA